MHRELLEGSRVKLITSATIGFDHIDTQYCDEAGIAWENSPGCNAVSVAQYVLAGLLTIASVRVNLYRERQSGSSESVMSAKKWKSCARPTG